MFTSTTTTRTIKPIISIQLISSFPFICYRDDFFHFVFFFIIKSNMRDTAYSGSYWLNKASPAHCEPQPLFLRKAGAGTNHPFPTAERARRQKGRTGGFPPAQARQRGERSVPPLGLAPIARERTGHGKGTRGPTPGRGLPGTTFDTGPARLRSD